MKVLKNLSRLRVETNFRGRRIVFLPKRSMVLGDDEESLALVKHLTSIYGFIIDRSSLYSKEVKKNEDTKKSNKT
jgi:hypothetical protein